MFFIKKGIAVVLLCVLCLCNSGTVLEAKGNDLTKDSHAYVSWATYYDSYEEMSEDSEAIVVGKVTASSTYIVDESVYTESTITVCPLLKVQVMI